MIDPGCGPFLFDTSAESWLARSTDLNARRWVSGYLARHRVHISAVTVLERVRGYSLLAQSAQPDRVTEIEAARIAYLGELGRVWPVDTSVAVLSGEIMALLPDPPTPPRRTHQFAETRQERLARWRFDCMIAATALIARMRLIHNNAADFEAIRSAIERTPRRFPGLGPLEPIRCTSLT